MCNEVTIFMEQLGLQLWDFFHIPPKEDVTYWLENGGSKEKLLELVSQNAC